MQNSNFEKLVKTTREHMDKDLDKYILRQCHEFVYNSMMRAAKEGSTVDYENPDFLRGEYQATNEYVFKVIKRWINQKFGKGNIKVTLTYDGMIEIDWTQGV